MGTLKGWQESVVYQICPKSFPDSNSDGIEDIRGIISKLDYIRQLGVDVIWICPLYPGPGYDNGYDTSDYEDVDPIFGSLADADMDHLIQSVHDRGMKLILDLVVNHSSHENSWFLEALSD